MEPMAEVSGTVNFVSVPGYDPGPGLLTVEVQTADGAKTYAVGLGADEGRVTVDGDEVADAGQFFEKWYGKAGVQRTVTLHPPGNEGLIVTAEFAGRR